MVGRVGMRLIDWRVEGNLPDLPKLVIIVAPHTSNWDFFVAILHDFALDLKVSWWGKDSIFVWPVSLLLRRLGGIPVRRSASHNAVSQIVQAFAHREQLVFALAPEGTRKKVTAWRSGFYYIAQGARVPIVMVALDYGRHRLIFSDALWPTGDYEIDLAAIKTFFAGVTPRNPELF